MAVWPESIAIVVVSNFTASVVLAGKLEPVSITEVPGGPEAGEGASRVELAVTVRIVAASISLFGLIGSDH